MPIPHPCQEYQPSRHRGISPRPSTTVLLNPPTHHPQLLGELTYSPPLRFALPLDVLLGVPIEGLSVRRHSHCLQISLPIDRHAHIRVRRRHSQCSPLRLRRSPHPC